MIRSMHSIGPACFVNHQRAIPTRYTRTLSPFLAKPHRSTDATNARRTGRPQPAGYPGHVSEFLIAAWYRFRRSPYLTSRANRFAAAHHYVYYLIHT